MKVTRSEVARRLLTLGARDALFKTSQVREALGVKTEDSGAATSFYNHFKALQIEGAIVLVPSKERARNRYFRIGDEEKLRQLATIRLSSVTSNGAKLPVVPERLLRIETSVQELRDRVENLESKLDQLVEMWS